ncbi:Molybdenum transport system permease protein ModB [bacterium HR39]|nr:Molybdenum transport system permease protein ModB [bacterium HR39]
MDWTALGLSLRLALLTCVLLVPLAVLLALWLRRLPAPAGRLVEVIGALPLVLPPTALGYWLLVALGRGSPLGELWERLTGRPLVFTFEGILLASLVFNLPFAVQPIARGLAAIPRELREAAWLCGLGPLGAFVKVELPLLRPSLVVALVLVFAHTLGEFGVVLMVGGAIPGETRTASVALYDAVQALDERTAALLSAVLLAFALTALLVLQLVEPRRERTR